MEVGQKKRELRRQMRTQLMAHQREVGENQRLVEAIASSEGFRHADRVGLFFPRAWEPDLLPLWQMRPEACVFPRVREQTLDFYSVPSLAAFAPGYRGIAEPAGEPQHHVSDWSPRSLILVPGVAFDRAGGRLGSGAGFYDRFCQGRGLILWGAGWSFQTVQTELAQEPTDARMVALATELGVFEVITSN